MINSQLYGSNSHFTVVRAEGPRKGMSMNESVLIVEADEMPTDSSEIFKRLVTMLESTGRVIDAERAVSDIKARDWASDLRMYDRLLLHHSKTDGVSDFCAAVIIFPGNVVHGIFAWPENSDDNLQRIAAVTERIQKIRLNCTCVKAA